jgi:molybdate transport system ATP-binding protein
MSEGLGAHLVVSPGNGFQLDIELEIPPGRTAALLGPNGAGKSTAVAALAGILPLEAGHIRLGGAVLDDPARDRFVPVERRRLGIVFQDYALFPHLSALDNVAFGLRGHGADRATARREAGRWLERLELGSLADRRPGDLSGGQAQRVALARALAVDPDLLLLDEPLAALDVTTRAQLRRVLAEHLAAHRGPRLLITHDPAEAFLLADTIYVIEGGRITQAGTADDIRRHPVTRYAADLAGINLMAGVATDGSLLLANGHQVAVADRSAHGATLATIHPRAIALYDAEPHGSPRNAWPTVVTALEQVGDRVRVQLGAPVPLTAEITPGAAAGLGLAPSVRVWIAIKASEIDLQPNPGVASDGDPGPDLRPAT